MRLGISCGGNHLTAAAREHRRSSSRLPRSGGSAGNRRAATIFTAATLCSLLALSSLAADRAQPLEPVIVTAPRAEATAQREPASVTPVFAEELEAAGIDDTRALRTYVPSLVVNQGGDRDSAFVSIRGLASAFVGPPAVGIYVDDVPYPDQRAAADVDLVDVDRVEVFRGSQVTRFGRYAEAGAIRITTRRPGQQVGGHASVRYGDFDTQVYQGAASGPLGRAAAFSLSGLESKRDGYIENRFLHTTLDDREQFAGRANLFLLPLSGLEIAFTGEADHAGEGPKALTLLDQPDPFEVRYDTRGHLRTDEYLAATRVAYTAPLWRIVSITARRSFAAERSAFDFDFSPRDVAVGGDNHRAVNWTEELRLSSPADATRWRWNVGGFFEDDRIEPRFVVRLDSTAVIQGPPPGGLGLPFTAPLENVQHARLSNRSASGFADSTLSLLETVELTLGLRYQSDTSRIRREHALHALAQGAAVPVVPTLRDSTRSAGVLPTVTLGWHARPPLLVYATVARGYYSARRVSHTSPTTRARRNTIRNGTGVTRWARRASGWTAA